MTATSVGRSQAPDAAPATTYRPDRAADIWPPLIAVVMAVLLLAWAGGGDIARTSSSLPPPTP